MPLARPNRDRIAWPYFPKLSVDLHFPGAAENVIDLLGLGVLVQLGDNSSGNSGFRQTLVSNRRVSVSKQFSDDRSVLGHEGLAMIPLDYFHFIISHSLSGGSLSG
jgi:hypothetical protein